MYRLSPKKIITIMTITVWFLSTPVQSLDISAEDFTVVQQFRDLKKTDLGAARLFIDNALKQNRSLPLLFEAAMLEADEDHYQKAIDYFSEILATDETFSGVYKNRGQLYLVVGDNERAIGDLLKGIEQEGVDRYSMKLIGQCYTEMGKTAAAEVALRWSLLHTPDDIQVYQLLAANMLEQRRFPEAEKLAETVIHQGRPEITTWMLLVNACLGQEKFDAALDHLEAARLVTMGLPNEMLQTLGDLYLQQGMTTESIAVFQEANKQKPLSFEKLKMLVDAFISQEDGENAQKIADMLLAIDSENADVHYYGACAAKLNGNIDAACNFAIEAIKRNSGYGKAFLLLGELYLGKGNFDDALRAVRTARTFSDIESKALEIELELWMKQENWSESLEILNILIQRYPDSNWIRIRDSIRYFE